MKTEIVSPRIAYTIKSTTGLLCVDGDFWNAWTLEDRIRLPGVKVQNETCIPAGRYKLSKRASPHLGREVIWLQNVPGFDLVYSHVGNKSEDTDACILTARNRVTLDFISGESLAIERKLFDYVAGRGWDDAWWTIWNAPGFESVIRAL